VSHPQGMPSFAKINGFEYSFEPKIKSHLGVYIVSGIITNTKYGLTTSYSFKVSVVNTPPRFEKNLESVEVI
jgi:hypothetical protein